MTERTFPGLERAARQWGVPEEALRRFLQRETRRTLRVEQREATGGLSVTLAHLVSAVVQLERKLGRRPARGEVEDQMRAQGFAPASGHVNILGLSYNLLAPPARYATAHDREPFVLFHKRTTPCRLSSTKPGRAWFRKHGRRFLDQAAAHRMRQTI